MAANEDYCLARVREGDRDRYLALLFSPAQQRGELAAIAAFNLELARAISEISEPTLSLIRLQWWREAIEEIAGGGPVRRHPVAEALQAATRARQLSTVRMLAMIGAREEEIDFPGAPSAAAFDARADSGPANLIRLSLQVAGTDPDAPALVTAIGAVGRAYALTGCARSVLIDARNRRVRLPADRLAQAGVDLDQLFELRRQPALVACLEGVARSASAELETARHASIPRQAKPLTIAGRQAALHLERLRRVAYDPFDPRLVSAPPFDVWRLLWTSVTGRF